MKEKINLFWYKKKGKGNFGDELGPYLVEKLSGLKVNYVPIINSPIKTLILFILGLINQTYDLLDFKNVIKGMFRKNVLITVGSILNINRRRSSNIWGAGIMSWDDKIVEGNFFAVRGKYSQKKLADLGYREPDAIGDPALLLPLMIKSSNKKFKLGIIPHYVHYSDVCNMINDEKINVINLLDNVENVVDQITSCEKTISTSLHGLIVSHTYGIESLWVKMSKIELAGDNIKFKDYFSSVDIEEYLPFVVSNNSLEKVEQIFRENKKISLIQNNLQEIQRSLIKAAPFNIIKEFKNV